MSRFENMTVVQKVETGAALLLTVAGIGAGVGCGEKSEPSVDATAAAATSNTPANVAELCDGQAYAPQGYKRFVGPDMVANLGPSGHFKSTDAEEVSKTVAEKVAPNDAAIATIDTIISSESGITANQVLERASDTLSEMQNNERTRRQKCVDVLKRVVLTPRMRKFQSPTGLIVDYSLSYGQDDRLGGLKSHSTTNTSNIEVFTIAPVEQSENAARDEAISDNWGITAEGEIIQTSHKEGNEHVSLKGNPVNPKKHNQKANAGGKNKHDKSEGSAGTSNGSSDDQAESQTPGTTAESNPGTVAGPNTNTGGPSGVTTGESPSPSGGGTGNTGGTPSGSGTPPQSTPPPHTTPPPHNTPPPSTPPHTLPPKDPPTPLPTPPSGY